MRDFLKELEAVRSGEVESFELDPNEFNDFYLVWNDYRFKSDIVGNAKKLGKIDYTKRK
jgi:hypothetical protein